MRTTEGTHGLRITCLGSGNTTEGGRKDSQIGFTSYSTVIEIEVQNMKSYVVHNMSVVSKRIPMSDSYKVRNRPIEKKVDSR